MELSQLDETTCSICDAEFLDAADLAVHVMQVHANRPATVNQPSTYCHFCASVFSNTPDYAKHILYTHVTSLKCCKYCTRLFTDSESLAEHQSKHVISTEHSLISCSQCEEMFSNAVNLDRHEYTGHANVNEGVMLHPYFSIFASILNINTYKFFHSLNKCEVFSCIICNYTNADVKEYIKHLKKNKCESFVCDHCSHVYTNKKGLGRHYTKERSCRYLTETPQGKRTCRQCKTQIPLWNYDNHTRVCKTVRCNLCNMKFKTMTQLQEHQAQKHPKAIVMTKCVFCFKEFVGTVALDRHMKRIHKPKLHLYKYKCVHCESRYYMHPKDMFAHFFSKHPELNPYECKICNMQFRVRRKFTIHIKMVHDSKGFVEFDENYNVFFSATKSENPFQPTSLFPSPRTGYDDSAYSQTEAETDAQTDAPTDVPTENEQDAAKTEKKLAKKPLKVRFKEQVKSNKRTVDEIDLTETEVEGQSEMDTKQKETRRVSSRKKIKKQQNTDTEFEEESESGQKQTHRRSINVPLLKKELLNNMDEIIGNSEDTSEDESLLQVKKRQKLKKILKHGNNRRGRKPGQLKKIANKLTCTICKKYCYTFQNFHHHISLHFRDEAKKCVVCNRQFPTKSELSRHINNDHKTSKLTETLKSMLERRKLNNYEKPELTTVEKFQKTIKKVNLPTLATCKTVAKITEIKDKLSVKNFLESFVPDENDVENPKAQCQIQTCVTVRTIDRPVKREPVIKMTKFVPKPEDHNIALALPVRFKQTNEEKQKVTVKLVQADNVYDYNVNDNQDDVDYYEEVVANNEEEKSETAIPDVAEEQEVQAESTEKTLNIPHTLVLPKDYLNSTSKIRIAHMLPQKPYYKIVKMEEIIQPEEKEKEMEQPVGPIRLPNGAKLVNVNPLAHLMGDKKLEDIVGKPARKKKYYKTKNVSNIQAAMAKALEKLEMRKERKKKAAVQKEVEEKNTVSVEQ